MAEQDIKVGDWVRWVGGGAEFLGCVESMQFDNTVWLTDGSHIGINQIKEVRRG